MSVPMCGTTSANAPKPQTHEVHKEIEMRTGQQLKFDIEPEVLNRGHAASVLWHEQLPTGKLFVI